MGGPAPSHPSTGSWRRTSSSAARRPLSRLRSPADDGRHAGLGPRRDLLPGLPGSVRGERARPQAGHASSRGTRHRRPTASRAATSAGSPSTSAISRISAITALYLNPVFTSASNHRYHTDDYLAVDPLLGGDDALRELLDAAHDRGMRVVLDGVFNHTGPRVLAVPPHPRERGRLAVSRLVPRSTTRISTPVARCSPTRRPGRRRRRSATRPGGACRPCRS